MKIVCAAEYVEIQEGYCNLCQTVKPIPYSAYIEMSNRNIVKLNLCEQCKHAKVFEFQ